MRKTAVEPVPQALTSLIPMLLFLKTLSRKEVLALYLISQKIAIFPAKKGSQP